MKIVIDMPPPALFDKLAEHFPRIKAGGVCITYGDTCYTDRPIPAHLQAHEEVHSEDQLAYPGGPDAYMDKFIADPAFRLEVEIKAYIVQLRFIRKNFSERAALSMLPQFAKQLSSDLYGNSITYDEARKRLSEYMKREKKK